MQHDAKRDRPAGTTPAGAGAGTPPAGADVLPLVSRWRVEGRVAEVAEILRDVERFPDWWGDVYLDVAILAPGDAAGVGRTAAVHSKGWLPYTLRWQGRVVAAEPPHSWTIEAGGDLEGRGVWTLRREGDAVEAIYDWRVFIRRPLFRLLAPALRPVFAANHRWAMARGLAGLRAELARRRAR